MIKSGTEKIKNKKSRSKVSPQFNYYEVSTLTVTIY